MFVPVKHQVLHLSNIFTLPIIIPVNQGIIYNYVNGENQFGVVAKGTRLETRTYEF